MLLLLNQANGAYLVAKVITDSRQELGHMEMLMIYFDQKIKKSRLTEFWYHWYHLVPPSQLVPKLVHMLLFIRIILY